MLKSFLLSLLFLGSTQLLFPVTNYIYESSYANSSSGGPLPIFDVDLYDIVWIQEYSNRCELHCIGSDRIACTWDNGFGGSSLTNPQLETVADDADVQHMTDHAIGQAEAGVFTGSYNSNLIVGSTTYYRTVTWNYNSTTQILDVDVSVSF